MSHTVVSRCLSYFVLVLAGTLTTSAHAQQPPYDVFPPANPPYFRDRHDASTQPSALIFPVNYTIWIPPDLKTVRGVVVHQHGCGEGTGVFGFDRVLLTRIGSLRRRNITSGTACHRPTSSPIRRIVRCGVIHETGLTPPFKNVWVIWARNRDILNWPKSPGHFGAIAAEVTGLEEWSCCIRNESSRPGFARASRC